MSARHLPSDYSRKPEAERHQLRATFDDVPELYDRSRPLYPAQRFDDVRDLSGIPARGGILEIGPGTGQATLPLAQAGYEIVGLELGEQLAAFARAKLSDFENVEIINAPFESWNVGDGDKFDAVVAFTAFHWLDPAVRFKKAAELLNPMGALVVATTQHVSPAGSDEFWSQVQEDYDAVDPSEANRPAPAPEEVRDLSREIQESGYFKNIATRRYLWDVTYSADEYIAVLDTYSGHRTLEASKRDDLYRRIRKRIEARPDAAVTKTYIAVMNIARKVR
jgi:SAM-dependent methyltransferase